MVALVDETHVGYGHVKVLVKHMGKKGKAEEAEKWILASNLSSPAEPAGQDDEAGRDTVARDPGADGSSCWGTDATLVTGWKDLLDDVGEAASFSSMKADAIFVMSRILERTPRLAEGRYLHVVHRASTIAARKTEVWTARSFKEHELVLAPWTTDIRDRMWTQGLAVSVKVPGEEIPGRRVFALDGRGRNHLEHAMPSKHVPGATGNLYWCVQRTSDHASANLTLKYCTVFGRDDLLVAMPGHRARSGIEEGTMPYIPVLVNDKAIPANTLLAAHGRPDHLQGKGGRKAEGCRGETCC